MGNGAWGTTRPRRDGASLTRGGTPLGAWEVWSKDLPGPSDPPPWEGILRLRRGSRTGPPLRSGGREARVSTVLKRWVAGGPCRRRAGTCGLGGGT